MSSDLEGRIKIKLLMSYYVCINIFHWIDVRHNVVNIRYANMSWDYSLDQFCEYKIREISATHVHCTCSTHLHICRIRI